MSDRKQFFGEAGSDQKMPTNSIQCSESLLVAKVDSRQFVYSGGCHSVRKRVCVCVLVRSA